MKLKVKSPYDNGMVCDRQMRRVSAGVRDHVGGRECSDRLNSFQVGSRVGILPSADFFKNKQIFTIDKMLKVWY